MGFVICLALILYGSVLIGGWMVSASEWGKKRRCWRQMEKNDKRREKETAENAARILAANKYCREKLAYIEKLRAEGKTI